jgi:hypothetical protein
MYVAIENKRELPLKFEKLEWLGKKLKSLAPSYQLLIERRMFDVSYIAEFQFALVRWMQDPSTWEKKRIIVLETKDLEQMESALFMLINTEEEDANNKH